MVHKWVLKPSAPRASLGWRPNRAIKAPLCGVITPRCCSPLGRVLVQPWQVITIHCARLPERKHPQTSPSRFQASALPSSCPTRPPLLLSSAAGLEERATPHPCAPQGGWGGKNWPAFPLSSLLPSPPDLSSWHLAHFPTDFQNRTKVRSSKSIQGTY